MMSENVCFLCSVQDKVCTDDNGRVLGAKARKTLKETAEANKDNVVTVALSSTPRVWMSNACYKRYTDKRNPCKTDEENSVSPNAQNKSFERRRRSAPYGYKTHCLICEGKLDFELAVKNPNVPKYQISEVNTVFSKTKDKGTCKLHKTLSGIVAKRTDQLAVEVAAKLAYAGCIRAEEAKYHRDCMQRFLNGKEVFPTQTSNRHFDRAKSDGFEKFCNWYESSNHDTTSSFTLFEVQKYISDNSNSDEEVYSIRQLSRKLSDRYGAESSHVRLTQRQGLPKIMLMQEEADSIITNTVLDNSVGTAAKIIRQSLLIDHHTKRADDKSEKSEIEDRTYPLPHELNLEKLTDGVPTELKEFLDILHSKSRTETANKKKHLRKIAIAHALMQFCKKEGYISPLLLSIGLFIHKVSRSRLLVDVLHAVGFSVSYSEVIKFEKCAAVSNLSSDDFVTSDEFESGNTFWQFIADNFDHNEDTTTGGNTTHVMGVISCETPKSDLTKLQPIKRREISSAQLLESARFNDNIKIYDKPSKSKFKQMILKKRADLDIDTTLYAKLDSYWIFCSLAIKNTPNWHGFMSNIIHGNHLPAQIKYHPNIPLDPSSYDAIYSTMSFVKQQIQQKRICCTSLTFDLPLFWKASEIKADKSPEFDHIHLKLGGFHQLMSFMGAGCKLMQDAGLKELWSTVYKENSLPKMLEGKAYSRCLRACLLTDAALHFTLLTGKDHSQTSDEDQVSFEPEQTFDDHNELDNFFHDGNIFDNLELDEELSENIELNEETDISTILIEKLKANCDDNDGLMLFNEETSNVLIQLYDSFIKQKVCAEEACSHPVIKKFEDIISTQKFLQDVSRTSKLWLQFTNFVSIIRMFIRAERTGNFQLHILSTEQMLPILAAAGHDKYTLAIVKYLKDIKNLCPCLEEKYNQGCFTVNRNDKLFWSGTFTDQIIEQTLMRSGKTQGGLINITHNDAARTKWLLSSHIVANYSEALRDLTGITTGTWSEQHRDVQASRRKENSNHLRNFIDFFDTHNPFMAAENQLINIATGVIASDDVNVDSAISIGEKIVAGFSGKCIGDISLKRKNQAKTFAVMRKTVTIGDTLVQMSSDQLSQRLLATVIRDEAPLREIFSHELSAVAPSLFHDNGEMRKNNKAELMNEIMSDLRYDSPDSSAFHIIDGCAWLYRIYWSKVGTILDLYGSFKQNLFAVCGRNANHICILFDGYTVKTTKGPEQKRRKKNLMQVKMKVKLKLPIPKDV